jgi:hypothetical protein
MAGDLLTGLRDYKLLKRGSVAWGLLWVTVSWSKYFREISRNSAFGQNLAAYLDVMDGLLSHMTS